MRGRVPMAGALLHLLALYALFPGFASAGVIINRGSRPPPAPPAPPAIPPPSPPPSPPPQAPAGWGTGVVYCLGSAAELSMFPNTSAAAWLGAPEDAILNVAYGKPTFASSVQSIWISPDWTPVMGPGFTVDGIIPTITPGFPIVNDATIIGGLAGEDDLAFATNWEPRPWWGVDLQADTTVYFALLYTRFKLSSNYLQNAVLRVGSTAAAECGAAASGLLERNAVCWRQPEYVAYPGQVIRAECGSPLVGRFVSLEAADPYGNNMALSVLEVEVYGRPAAAAAAPQPQPGPPPSPGLGGGGPTPAGEAGGAPPPERTPPPPWQAPPRPRRGSPPASPGAGAANTTSPAPGGRGSFAQECLPEGAGPANATAAVQQPLAGTPAAGCANIALGRPTFASSVSPQPYGVGVHSSRAAVDGVVVGSSPGYDLEQPVADWNTHLETANMWLSGNEASPWWAVDLQGPHLVHYVLLHTRFEQRPGDDPSKLPPYLRMRSAELRVGDVPIRTCGAAGNGTDSSLLSLNALCWWQSAPVQHPGEVVVAQCEQPLLGSWLTLQDFSVPASLGGVGTQLGLYEIEVYGHPADGRGGDGPSPPPSLPPPGPVRAGPRALRATRSSVVEGGGGGEGAVTSAAAPTWEADAPSPGSCTPGVPLVNVALGKPTFAPHLLNANTSSRNAVDGIIPGFTLNYPAFGPTGNGPNSYFAREQDVANELPYLFSTRTGLLPAWVSIDLQALHSVVHVALYVRNSVGNEYVPSYLGIQGLEVRVGNASVRGCDAADRELAANPLCWRQAELVRYPGQVVRARCDSPLLGRWVTLQNLPTSLYAYQYALALLEVEVWGLQVGPAGPDAPPSPPAPGGPEGAPSPPLWPSNRSPPLAPDVPRECEVLADAADVIASTCLKEGEAPPPPPASPPPPLFDPAQLLADTPTAELLLALHNVALSKPTFASSTLRNGTDSGRAVDGVIPGLTSGHIFSGTPPYSLSNEDYAMDTALRFSTAAELEPWWSVDLTEPHLVLFVVLYNLYDGFYAAGVDTNDFSAPYTFVKTVEVRVGDTPVASCGAGAATLRRNELCYRHGSFPMSGGEAIRAQCAEPLVGRWVTAHRPAANASWGAIRRPLNLLEVEVYGVALSRPLLQQQPAATYTPPPGSAFSNAALGKPTFASSIMNTVSNGRPFAFDSSLAVDGIIPGLSPGYPVTSPMDDSNAGLEEVSVFATDPDTWPWLAVDLQESYIVSHVMLYMRWDARDAAAVGYRVPLPYRQLRLAEVRVGDSPVDTCSSGQAELKRNPLCWQQQHARWSAQQRESVHYPGQVVVAACGGPMVGRWVTLAQAPPNGYWVSDYWVSGEPPLALNLLEVEVYGVALRDVAAPPPSLGGPPPLAGPPPSPGAPAYPGAYGAAATPPAYPGPSTPTVTPDAPGAAFDPQPPVNATHCSVTIIGTGLGSVDPGMLDSNAGGGGGDGGPRVAFASINCTGPEAPVSVSVGRLLAPFAANFTGVALRGAAAGADPWAGRPDPTDPWDCGVSLHNTTRLELVDSVVAGVWLGRGGPLLHLNGTVDAVLRNVAVADIDGSFLAAGARMGLGGNWTSLQGAPERPPSPPLPPPPPPPRAAPPLPPLFAWRPPSFNAAGSSASGNSSVAATTVYGAVLVAGALLVRVEDSTCTRVRGGFAWSCLWVDVVERLAPPYDPSYDSSAVAPPPDRPSGPQSQQYPSYPSYPPAAPFAPPLSPAADGTQQGPPPPAFNYPPYMPYPPDAPLALTATAAPPSAPPAPARAAGDAPPPPPPPGRLGTRQARRASAAPHSGDSDYYSYYNDTGTGTGDDYNAEYNETSRGNTPPPGSTWSPYTSPPASPPPFMPPAWTRYNQLIAAAAAATAADEPALPRVTLRRCLFKDNDVGTGVDPGSMASYNNNLDWDGAYRSNAPAGPGSGMFGAVVLRWLPARLAGWEQPAYGVNVMQLRKMCGARGAAPLPRPAFAVEECLLAGNRGVRGAALAVLLTRPDYVPNAVGAPEVWPETTLTGSVFANNTAAVEGGALWHSSVRQVSGGNGVRPYASTVQLRNCDVRGNEAPVGAGLLLQGDFKQLGLHGSTLRARGYGGSIFASVSSNGPLVVTGNLGELVID